MLESSLLLVNVFLAAIWCPKEGLQHGGRILKTAIFSKLFLQYNLVLKDNTKLLFDKRFLVPFYNYLFL
jgi:hypothetical protein